ncbi:MAG TPA: branched-chain amino acid ABC transporter permease [Tepidisphaeraceae bacterium]|nr:branched-chain amino acid ABC transporter permease [Tepidisphaeraceae bacterium]
MTADDANNFPPPAPTDEAPPAAPPYSAGPPPRAVAPRRIRRLPAGAITVLSNVPLLLLLLLPMAGAYIEGPYSIPNPRSLLQNVHPTVQQFVLAAGLTITMAVSLHLINGVSGQFSLGHAGFITIGAYLGGYAALKYSANFTASPGVLLYFVALFATLAVAAAGIALLYFVIRAGGYVARFLPGLLLIVLFAWVVVDMILRGHPEWGQPDIAGVLTGGRVHLPYSPVWPYLFSQLGDLFGNMLDHGAKPLTLILVLIGGGVGAAVAGFVVGLPALRLRGDYLAIVTLGFALIITTLVELTPALGEATGLTGIPQYNARVRKPEGFVRTHHFFPWVYGVAIVTTFVVWRMTRSPVGRGILATREDEVAAASIGIGTTRYKVLAFVVGAFFAGVAGALHAVFDYSKMVTPKTFDWDKSVELVVIVTVGGLGNLWGAILAAIVLTFLQNFLQSPTFWIDWFARPFRGEGAAPTQFPASIGELFAWMNRNRMVIYALILVLFMLLKSRDFSAILPRWRRKAGTSS